MNNIVWLRNDLRIENNLVFSMSDGKPLIVLFIISEEQWKIHNDSPYKIEFWLRNLQEISKDLIKLNIPLKIIYTYNWKEIPNKLLEFCKKYKSRNIFANFEYGLNEQNRDSNVDNLLCNSGIKFTLFHDGSNIFKIGSILNQKGEPYRVFTKFADKCQSVLFEEIYQSNNLKKIKKQYNLPCQPDQIPKNLFRSVPDNIRELWPAGEKEANKRLIIFLSKSLKNYKKNRDFPNLNATSKLSPYISSGVISVKECIRKAIEYAEIANYSNNDIKSWLIEIFWREFYIHLLASFPSISKREPFRKQTISWKNCKNDIEKWRNGETGFPIIDAAQKQLLKTGWMHNRLRMISATFLTKNLLVDWRIGEDWFMSNLIDGDLASNNGGWQWAASTGASCNPYFRIFNPVLQSKKFDKDGSFIKKWLSKLKELNKNNIHCPSNEERIKYDYTKSIVDIEFSNSRYLKLFKSSIKECRNER